MGRQTVGLENSIRVIPIVNTNGKYAAGSDGHIYCYSYSKKNPNRPVPFRVAEFQRATRYPQVTMLLEGKRKSINVHTLICTSFHGERPFPRLVVRHLDGTRDNNCPENLSWGTYAQNESDKRRHGRLAIGEKQGIAKLTDDAVRIIRASIPYGLWNAKDAAQVFGMSQQRIRSIARGEGWPHIPCAQWLFVRKHSHGGQNDSQADR